MSAGKSPVSALISAEHASNAVPAAYRSLFVGAEAVLDTHRAWDHGSGELARDMSRALGAPLLEGQVTRLLVDLNRSRGHPRHLSEFSRQLEEPERERLIEQYWTPHWQAFRQAIENAHQPLIHIACHSFTPVLDGVVRDTDIGLLYDPSRPQEKAWCRALAGQIRRQLPGLKVRMNNPYLGTSNGMGQQHRKHFADTHLITMEIEINARLVDGRDWAEVRRGLIAAVAKMLGV
jgi:predicted N-formylglutamate amidohydrolase